MSEEASKTSRVFMMGAAVPKVYTFPGGFIVFYAAVDFL